MRPIGHLTAQVSIFNDDGKRSRAVDVRFFRAKPIVKGGLGGNRSGVWLMGFNFRDFFLCFF